MYYYSRCCGVLYDWTKCVRVCVCQTEIWGDWARKKKIITWFPLYSPSQIQKTSDDKVDHGPSGNKANAASATQQQAISTAFLSSSKYKTESKEQQTKEQAIARWVGCTGLPLTTIEDEDFVLMMEIVDKRLTVPKKTKISNLIETQYEHERHKFKERLAAARRVSIGLDLWTKKGLTASFLAISACYFCVEQSKPVHILLALEQVAHPHTAQSIKACVDKCMQE